MEIESYQVCSCGALTFNMSNGSSYSVQKRNLKKFFPDLDLRTLKGKKMQDCFCCNHCVNHYGLDLCGCGSGEPFGKCENGFEECKIPMQLLGSYDRVRADDALI